MDRWLMKKSTIEISIDFIYLFIYSKREEEKKGTSRISNLNISFQILSIKQNPEEI